MSVRARHSSATLPKFANWSGCCALSRLLLSAPVCPLLSSSRDAVHSSLLPPPLHRQATGVGCRKRLFNLKPQWYIFLEWYVLLDLQGTGQHCRDVGNEVQSITVVNTTGTATYTSSHPLWPVIRGNFGLMGIVSDITFHMDSNFENPYGEGGGGGGFAAIL